MKKSIGQFSDVMHVFNAVMQSTGEARYRLSSAGKAINFRQRCNKYRQVKRSLHEEGLVPGQTATIPEDTYALTIVDSDGKTLRPGTKTEDYAPGPHDVVFRPRVMEGELLDEDGKPIELAPEFETEEFELPDFSSALEGLDLD